MGLPAILDKRSQVSDALVLVRVKIIAQFHALPYDKDIVVERLLADADPERAILQGVLHDVGRVLAVVAQVSPEANLKNYIL